MRKYHLKSSSISWSVLFAILVIFASCEEEVQVPELSIIANAGPNQTVRVGDDVVLNGAKSSSSGGEALSYSWTFVSMPDKSNVQISSPNNVATGFIPDVEGEYVVRLTVAAGGKENASEAIIHAESAGAIVVDRNISSDKTWTKQTPDGEPDYILAAKVQVSAHLTIEPGVIVVAQEGSGLEVTRSGVLTAEGTDVEHIIFTAQEKEPGYWSGIVFNSTESTQNRLAFVEVLYGGRETNLGAAGIGIVGKVGMKNCVIAYSGNAGLGINGSFHSFEGNSFMKNGGYAIVSTSGAAGGIAGDTFFERNGFDGVLIRGGELNEAASWNKLENGSYAVQDKLEVNNALTINPGAHFIMGEDARIEITDKGTLKAIGTQADSIIFEGKLAEQGYWDGIIFIYSQSIDNELQYVRVSHGGGTTAGRGTANVVVGGDASHRFSEVKINNSLFSESAGAGIEASANSIIHAFEHNVFKNNQGAAAKVFTLTVANMSGNNTYIGNNGRDGLEVVGGRTADGGKWLKLKGGAPYFISDDVDFLHPMEIEAGAILRFAENTKLLVNGSISNTGTLTARGTAAEPIRFLPDRDDIGTQAYWNGIDFRNSHSIDNLLDYVEIANGGKSDTKKQKGNILLREGSRVEVTNSLIRNSGGHGIAVLHNDDEVIERNNTFENNARGDIRKL